MEHRQEVSKAVLSDLFLKFSEPSQVTQCPDCFPPSPWRYRCSWVMDFVLLFTRDLQWVKRCSLGNNGFSEEKGIDGVIPGENSDNGIDWKDMHWGWCYSIVIESLCFGGSLSYFYSIVGNFTLLESTLAYNLCQLFLLKKISLGPLSHFELNLGHGQC